MNRDYLVNQLGMVEEYVSRARSVGGRSREEFLKDYVLIDAAIRELTVLFETCHNIAKHLIAESGWRVATSKAEAFEVLAEKDVIPVDLCNSLRKASRFRNLATYQTSILDVEVVYDVLNQGVGDFELFAGHVARWLERNA